MTEIGKIHTAALTKLYGRAALRLEISIARGAFGSFLTGEEAMELIGRASDPSGIIDISNLAGLEVLVRATGPDSRAYAGIVRRCRYCGAAILEFAPDSRSHTCHCGAEGRKMREATPADAKDAADAYERMQTHG